MSDTAEPKAATQDTTAPVEEKPAAEAPKAEAKEDEKKEEVQYGDEEEKTTEKLENKEGLATGNEDEEPVWINKAKLYRFRDGKWKERGNGYCKLLRHTEKKRIRFVLRTEKTKKVSANFYVAPAPL